MGDTDRTPDGGFSAGYMCGGNPNLRKAAAYTYQALLGLASTQLGVPVVEPHASRTASVSGGGKSVTYGQLVSGQAAEPDDSRSRQPAEPLRPVGHRQPADEAGQRVHSRRPVRRRCATIPPIVAGTATYVGDVRLPGHASRPRRAPADARLEARLGRASSTRSGSRTRRSSSRATSSRLVDPSEYSAIQAASRARRARRSGPSGQGCRAAATSSRRSATADWTTTPVDDGRQRRATPEPALATAAKKLSATYECPFEKHAPIGPTVAVADVRKDGTVYVHVHSAEPAGDALGARDDAQHLDRQRRRPQLRRLGSLRPLERRQRPAPRTRR